MKRCLFFFRFEPAAFADVLLMDDQSAGRRFKELLARLLSGDAPEGSREAEMIREAEGFRSGADARKPAARQERTKPAPPSKYDVYEFCERSGVSQDYAAEFIAYNDARGWPLRKSWQSAYRGFVREAERKDHE